LFISSIEAGSSAARSGLLHQNDEIVKVKIGCVACVCPLTVLSRCFSLYLSPCQSCLS
jgi:hypothetical protein